MSFKSTDDLTAPEHMKRSHSTSSNGVPLPVVEIDLPDAFQQSPSANLMNKPLPPKPTECDSSEQSSSKSEAEECETHFADDEVNYATPQYKPYRTRFPPLPSSKANRKPLNLPQAPPLFSEAAIADDDEKYADDEELHENIGETPQPILLRSRPKYLEKQCRETFVLNTAKPECVEEAVHTLLDYKAFDKTREFELINVHGMQREEVLKVHGAVHNKQTLDVQRIDIDKVDDMDKVEKFLREGQQDDFKGFIVNYAARGRWFAIRCYGGDWYKLEPDLDSASESYKKEDFFNTNNVHKFLNRISRRSREESISKLKADIYICQSRADEASAPYSHFG